MECTQFYIALVDYIETCILSKVPSEVLRWCAGGALVLLPRALDTWMSQHIQQLQFMGLLTESGDVSIRGLSSWLNSAFKSQPQLTVKIDDIVSALIPNCLPCVLDALRVKITFTRADADALMRKLGAAPAQPK